MNRDGFHLSAAGRCLEFLVSVWAFSISNGGNRSYIPREMRWRILWNDDFVMRSGSTASKCPFGLVVTMAFDFLGSTAQVTSDFELNRHDEYGERECRLISDVGIGYRRVYCMYLAPGVCSSKFLPEGRNGRRRRMKKKRSGCQGNAIRTRTRKRKKRGEKRRGKKQVGSERSRSRSRRSKRKGRVTMNNKLKGVIR